MFIVNLIKLIMSGDGVMDYYKDEIIYIRMMKEEDIDYFTNCFLDLKWGNRRNVLKEYFSEQKLLKRNVLVAEYNGSPVGYITLVYNAQVGPFAKKQIPEIKDFNVLPPYRKLGIGGLLMDCIEAVAKDKSSYVTLGVGMNKDYGSAQRMYVKRGYIPDGSGLWYGNKNLMPYENCQNDDDLNLYFIKQLTEN